MILAYSAYSTDPGSAAVIGLISLFFYIGIPLLFARGGYVMATSRGRHQWGWAIASFFTGVIALIALAIVGETQAVKQQRADVAAERAARLAVTAAR